MQPSAAHFPLFIKLLLWLNAIKYYSITYTYTYILNDVDLSSFLFVSTWIVNSNHVLDLQYDIEECVYNTVCYNIFLFIWYLMWSMCGFDFEEY